MRCKVCGNELESNANFCTNCGHKITFRFINKIKEQLKIADDNEPITDYVIIDFETNGLNPKSNRIIEIGAVKVSNKEVVDTFETFVNPMRNITKKITDINGITNEMVMDAPTEDVILPEFIEFVKDLPITAYNISFDLNFFEAALNRMNNHIESVLCFDALKIARANYPELPNHKLETVMQHLYPGFEQPHRALQDCFAVKHILDRTTVTYGMTERINPTPKAR